VQTNASGEFEIRSPVNPQFTPYRATVTAAGYLTREAYITWAPSRTDVTIDLIRNAAPFVLSFYRELVRNAFDAPNNLEIVRRWITNPNLYITTADQNGRPIEPEVLALVVPTARRAVSDWTSGRLQAGITETGPSNRPDEPGWIVIEIVRDDSAPFCGRAFVGRDPGRVTLVNDRCACGSTKISGDLVMHEMGHALGFWHVRNRSSVMFPVDLGGCPSGRLNPSERHHAAIAYARPVGNSDVDEDPISGAFVTPPVWAY
jgi:hypothetical protein